jgi:hypothetical protein
MVGSIAGYFFDNSRVDEMVASDAASNPSH